MPCVTADQLQKIFEQILFIKNPRDTRYLPQFFAYLMSCGEFLTDLDENLGRLRAERERLEQQQSRGMEGSQGNENWQAELAAKIGVIQQKIDADLAQLNLGVEYILVNHCKSVVDKEHFVDFLEWAKAAINALIDSNLSPARGATLPPLTSPASSSYNDIHSENMQRLSMGKFLFVMLNKIIGLDVVAEEVERRIKRTRDIVWEVILVREPLNLGSIPLDDLFSQIAQELNDRGRMLTKKGLMEVVKKLIAFSTRLASIKSEYSYSDKQLKVFLSSQPYMNNIKKIIAQLPEESVRSLQEIIAAIKPNMSNGHGYGSNDSYHSKYENLQLAMSVLSSITGGLSDRMEEMDKDAAAAVTGAFNCALAMKSDVAQAMKKFSMAIQQLEQEVQHLPEDDNDSKLIREAVKDLREVAAFYNLQVVISPSRLTSSAQMFLSQYNTIFKHLDSSLSASFKGNFAAANALSCIKSCAAILCSLGLVLLIPPVRHWCFHPFKIIKSTKQRVHAKFKQADKVRQEVVASAIISSN